MDEDHGYDVGIGGAVMGVVEDVWTVAWDVNSHFELLDLCIDLCLFVD